MEEQPLKQNEQDLATDWVCGEEKGDFRKG